MPLSQKSNAGFFEKFRCHQGLRINAHVHHGIGHDGDVVEIAEPIHLHAANQVPGHQGVDVAVGQHDEAGSQCRQDDVLQLVGEIRRVKQAQRGPAENVPALGFFELLAHQRRTLQTHLYRGMSSTFQPLDQFVDLSRPAGTVGAFHHDQAAGQLLQIDPGNSTAVETLRIPPRLMDIRVRPDRHGDLEFLSFGGAFDHG